MIWTHHHLGTNGEGNGRITPTGVMQVFEKFSGYHPFSVGAGLGRKGTSPFFWCSIMGQVSAGTLFCDSHTAAKLSQAVKKPSQTGENAVLL